LTPTYLSRLCATTLWPYFMHVAMNSDSPGAPLHAVSIAAAMTPTIALDTAVRFDFMFTPRESSASLR